MSLIPEIAVTWEGTSPVLMARIFDSAGVDIQQAGIDTVTYYVYDETGTLVGTSSTLTVATVVFDTLQTGAPWTKDTTGYNFKWTMSPTLTGTLLPKADSSKIYRIEIILVATTTAYVTPVVFVLGRNNLISQAAS